MNVEKPETVNEGYEFEKPKNEPAPVERFVIRFKATDHAPKHHWLTITSLQIDAP